MSTRPPDQVPTASDPERETRLRSGQIRRWVLFVGKVVVIAVVVAWLAKTLHGTWSELRDRPWRFDVRLLGLSAIVYLVGLLPCALFWKLLLHRLGQRVAWLPLLRAYYIGHLGKYVPGKAMVVVLRAGLIHNETTSLSVIGASVFLETLTMMAAGAMIAASLLAAAFREQTLFLVASLGLAVAAGLPTIPAVFRFIAKLARVGGNDPAVVARLRGVNAPTLLLGWTAMLVTWVMLGWSFWLVIASMNALPGWSLGDMPRCVASVSLAMVAGFLSLIPGGLGVRDAILTELLAPRFFDTLSPAEAFALALAAAAMLRAVWLVAEVAASAVLRAVGHRTPAQTVQSK